MAKFARVIVDQSGGNSFVYEIPALFTGKIAIGSRVRVPVRTRVVLATVVALLDETDAEGVRPISEIKSERPIFSPSSLRLAEWIANYYCCAVEPAMRAVLPQVIRKAEVKGKEQLVARLLKNLSDQELTALKKRAPNQATVVEFLTANNGPVAITQLLKKCDVGRETVRALEKRGLVCIEPERIERDPHRGETFLSSPKLDLNAEQKEVFAAVSTAIENPAGSQPILLHGVTG
ncbi:MAG: primosomal protein N', partial [Verrucomicrobiota bacterium]|nr:primosomal protein N' [Verrucomicrobiota bacterium]